MKYFKFHYQTSGYGNKKYSLIENFMAKFLSLIIPKANPDFENKYDLVSLWYIEYDDEQYNCAIREIGLDSNKEIIVKAPYKKNYGFWTDSSATMDDYKKWNIEYVSPNIFNDLWEKDISF
jgi:hypothetical protein